LSLPAGWKSYRDHARRAAAAEAVPAEPAPATPFAPTVAEPAQDNRQARLN
jgi:CDP-diacylglycerol--serine O-phosphatidyltransferase